MKLRQYIWVSKTIGLPITQKCLYMTKKIGIDSGALMFLTILFPKLVIISCT